MKASETVLTEGLKKFSRQGGGDLFGVADLALAKDFIAAQSPFPIAHYPRAVSVGMQLIDSIVDIHSPDEPRRQSLYWHHVYGVVTPALDSLAYDLARWLTGQGFRALPVPGSTPYDFDKLKGFFSHKLAAHLAGVGWIGKSCLLLTERFGPRVRFVSVLTDAPLQTGSPLDRPCGKII
jgi:epoxyqueuosine reductase